MKAAIVLTTVLAACAPNYSDGIRAGVVVKLSHKGLIWKSWEGSLNQGGTKNVTGANGNTVIVANTVNFNVSDPIVIAKLQEAMNSGARVEISYRQWFLAPPTIENDRVVISAKIIAN